MKAFALLTFVGLLVCCSTYSRNGDECIEGSDCLGLPHDDCLGSFECIDGTCSYECMDLTSCTEDSDCALADKECCCGFEADDYVAIRQDRLADWLGRPECQGYPCPEIDCLQPEGLRAICDGGQCATDVGSTDHPCTRDSDCVKVPDDCCGCEQGGKEAAVHKDRQEQYLEELQDFCMLADYWCPGTDTCTTRPAVCREGRCLVQGDQCHCGDSWNDWNPVCAQAGGEAPQTLVNPCQAECLGWNWFYPGKCECLVDCFQPDPWCASNGETYGCGQFEVECNGLEPLYPGECDPACDSCQDVPLPEPVCGEDFHNYWNSCYLTCRDMDFWHDGMCQEGEGQACGPGGLPCPGDDLFCLFPPGCLECPGQCILLGHCIQPEDCLEQPLTHDACEGEWTCPDISCLWQCL